MRIIFKEKMSKWYIFYSNLDLILKLNICIIFNWSIKGEEGDPINKVIFIVKQFLIFLKFYEKHCLIALTCVDFAELKIDYEMLINLWLN